MSEFDGIDTLAGWQAALKKLLEAADSTAGKSLQERLDLNERFLQFMIQSPPDDPAVEELDGIAAQARKDMLRKEIDDRVAAIHARTGDLALVTKRIEAGTLAAKTGRIEQLTGVVDSLTKSVEALRDLRSGIEEGTDAELLGKIERAITSVQNLRNRFDKLVDA